MLNSIGFSFYNLPHIEISANYGEQYWIEISWLFFRLCYTFTKGAI